MTTEPIPANQPEPAPAPEQSEVQRFKTVIREYGQPALIGLGIALAIILGLTYFRGQKQSSEKRAYQMLLTARNVDQLQQIITQYGSTPTAPIAMLTLAAQLYSGGQYEQAQTLYAQFSAKYPQHPMRQSAELGVAHCIEAEGRVEEALDAFERFAKGNPGNFLTPLAQLGAARCLTQLGRYDEARTLYEDFVAANPKSGWAPLAETALLFVDKEKRALQEKQTNAPAPVTVTSEVLPVSPAIPAPPAKTAPAR